MIPDSQINTQMMNQPDIFQDADLECEDVQWDRPPTPPLAGENINLAEDANFK
jgi:hypothetical protein